MAYNQKFLANLKKDWEEWAQSDEGKRMIALVGNDVAQNIFEAGYLKKADRISEGIDKIAERLRML